MPSTASAVNLPFKEAIDFFRQKTDTPSAHWTTVMDEAHARSFAVAGATKDALISDFREAIDKAISQGTSYGEFKKDFDALVKKYGWSHTGTADWRARVIYNTNLSTAFSAGRYAQMTDPDVLAAFPYRQYQHINCPNPRLQHVAWSGMVLRADDPFWSTCYPPNGWGCHCIVLSVSERGLARLGKSGPDASPKLQWREYVNRTTGVLTKYPAGVDPGFVGNPGKAWLNNKPQDLKAPNVRPASPQIPLPKPERFTSPEQANEVLQAAMAPWAASMSAAQNAALDDYKGTLGRQINAVARGDAKNPALAQRVEILRTALAQAKMPMTVRTFRVVGPDEARLYAQAQIGETVTAAQFVSTTVVEEVAQKLRRQNQALIQIILEQGTKGAAYVHPFPGYRFRQYEVLLNIGTKLRIVRNDNSNLVLVAGPSGNE